MTARLVRWTAIVLASGVLAVGGALAWYRHGHATLALADGQAAELPSPRAATSVIDVGTTDAPRRVTGAGGRLWSLAPMTSALTELDAVGRPTRVVQLAQPVMDVAVDDERGLVYGVTYGTHFSLGRTGPVLTDSALVTVFALADGRTIRRFGKPRIFRGVMTGIVANQVRLAVTPAGDLLVVWPHDGLADLWQGGTRRVALGNLPFVGRSAVPVERRIPGTFTTRVYLPPVVHDVVSDDRGNVLALVEDSARGRRLDVLALGARRACSMPVDTALTRLLPASDGIAPVLVGAGSPVRHLRYRCDAGQGA